MKLVGSTRSFQTPEPKAGDLRVWYAYGPGSMDKFLVNGLGEAMSLIRKLDNGESPSATGGPGIAAGLEAYNVDDIEGWSEWYDPETGDDINAMSELYFDSPEGDTHE